MFKFNHVVTGLIILIAPASQMQAAVPTIVSLPGAPTRAGVKFLAVNAVATALQAGGTLAQVQNAAAQQLLGNLNAPNAVNPNGGTVTLAQALALVNAAAPQVAVAGGTVVPVTLPPQPGQPGVVTINQVIPFTPQQTAILAQMTSAAFPGLPAPNTPVVVTPAPVAPVVVTPTPVTPVVVAPTPATPVVVQTPPVPAPVLTPPVKAGGNGGGAVLNNPVVLGSALPQFTPDQLFQMGLPACYPSCFPPAPRITGVVTPTGGKGVKLAGPVTPWIFKLVIKAGQPVIETIRAGFPTTFTPVPPQFLAASVQPVAVQTPAATVAVKAPVAKVTPVKGAKGGATAGSGGPGYAIPGEVIATPVRSGKRGHETTGSGHKEDVQKVESVQVGPMQMEPPEVRGHEVETAKTPKSRMERTANQYENEGAESELNERHANGDDRMDSHAADDKSDRIVAEVREVRDNSERHGGETGGGSNSGNGSSGSSGGGSNGGGSDGGGHGGGGSNSGGGSSGGGSSGGGQGGGSNGGGSSNGGSHGGR